MAKRHKTSKTGVFWRESTTNGKKDKTFYIIYKDERNIMVETKVGKESQGIGVKYAYQKYNETINNVRLGEEPPIKRKRRNIFTFSDAFESYIVHAKANKKTWAKDRENYNNHLDKFHNLELTTLTQHDFNILKTEKLEIYSESTVKHILAVARQVINHAINNDLVKYYANPIAKGRVHMKQPNNKKLGYLTQEQASKILNELKGLASPQMYNMTVVLLFTGARFSEVASLTWHDINFTSNMIFFKATKDGNERSIPMTPLVKEVLTSLSEDNILVLPSSNGKQVMQMPKQWQEIVDKIIPMNKLEKMNKEQGDNLSDSEKLLRDKQKKRRITTHSLRHTHASWMAMSNKFSLLEIKNQLGHKSLQMTERYSHLMKEERHKKHSDLFDEYTV